MHEDESMNGLFILVNDTVHAQTAISEIINYMFEEAVGSDIEMW